MVHQASVIEKCQKMVRIKFKEIYLDFYAIFTFLCHFDMNHRNSSAHSLKTYKYKLRKIKPE